MYATPDDILARYGATAYTIAGAGDDGEPDRAAMERALEAASGEMDAALRGRYALPPPSAPPLLRRLCIDLAVAQLPRNGAGEAGLFERRGGEARKLLAALADGTLTLDLPTVAGPDSGAGGAGGGVAYAFPPSPLRGALEDY